MTDNSNITPNEDVNLRTGMYQVNRNARGQFKKGYSGNKGGRPKLLYSDLKEKCQALGESAIEVLTRLMNGDDPRCALAAAKIILSYAYGNPTPTVESEAENGAINVISDKPLSADEWAEKYARKSL